MFLTKDELKTVATSEVIDLIINGTETTVTKIIAENIDAMKSYIFKYYDTEAIFIKEGDERSMILVKHLKSMVIADIYFIRKKELPEGIEKRYDEAMRWLEKVASGNIEPDLPKKNIDIDGDGIPDEAARYMKLGSRKSYKNHF